MKQHPRNVAVAAFMSAAALVGLIGTADAQAVPTVSIGRISSEKTCTLYQESAGRSDTVVTPYVAASSESWRTWLVRDCVSHFATIRASLEAALAASGKIAVRGNANYILSGTLSQVDDGGPQSVSSAGYAVSSQKIFVSMELALHDGSGRTVYGGLLTKHLEVGSSIQTPGLSSSSGQSGEAVYTELQNQVALAAARLVAFHIVPLRVVANEGDQIRLNYGAPLLALGTVVHATSADGATTVRYSVVSADPGGATAQKDGDGAADRIAPGSLATVIEADDPAANERRYRRVDLP